MLDGRVYRTAFLPALVAIFVAAFALQDRPNPARTSLPADAFEGARALGSDTNPAPQSLRGMAASYPDLTPGSAGDHGLADLVARDLATPDEGSQRPAFSVRRTTSADGFETVIATRPGISNRRIVVLADRDANGLAALSGTAALLELGRVYKSRELRKTLVLVSTTGTRDGFGGARAWAKTEAGGPVDGVIVLGDLAGTSVRKPWVVSWPASDGAVPLGLERTVQSAIRKEARADPGAPHAAGQWMRRAIPVTVSEQGPIGAEGLPTVLISESGELGPKANEPVSDTRLERFGRAAVRAVGAIDASGPANGRAFAGTPRGIVTLRNVLSDWSVRLVVGSLLLPALLAALDSLARARRRRVPIAPWIAWLAVAAVPLPVMWVWLRVLGATGMIDVPAGQVLPQGFPLGTSGWVAVGSAVLAAALATWIVRFAARLLGRPAEEAPANGRRARPAPSAEGLAVATAVWICVVVAVAWFFNPYAAALLIPAAHLWLFAAGRWSARIGIPALLAGLVLPLLAFVYIGMALDLGPLELVWGAVLAAAAGLGSGTTLLFAGLFAAAAGVVRVLFARHRLGQDADASGDQFRTRGPVSYAGPGSLGGTESALRR